MPKLTTGSKTVTTAGAAERLIALASNVSVLSVTIVAKQTNTGKLYTGNSAVASSNTPALDAGESIKISAGEPFNIADIYLDVSVNGEGADYYALA